MSCQGEVDVNIKLELLGEEMTVEGDAIQFENIIHINGWFKIHIFYFLCK